MLPEFTPVFLDVLDRGGLLSKEACNLDRAIVEVLGDIIHRRRRLSLVDRGSVVLTQRGNHNVDFGLLCLLTRLYSKQLWMFKLSQITQNLCQ